MGMPSRRTNNFPESGRGLGHMTPTIFGSTVGYPSESLASCLSLSLIISKTAADTAKVILTNRKSHGFQLTLMTLNCCRGSPSAEASNKGGVGKISSFLSLSLNISKRQQSYTD